MYSVKDDHEHIPKYQVSDNKVKRCVEPRNANEIPREETRQTHRVKIIIQDDTKKSDSTDTQTHTDLRALSTGD